MSLQLRPVELEKAERLYTNQEFEELPAFYERYELIEGKLVERMSTGGEHGRIGGLLEKRINFFDPEEKIGLVWHDTSFNIAPGFIPTPDLAFVTLGRMPVIDKKALKVVPDLVVEVHSPSDLESKAGREAAANKIRKYQAAGVKIVWAVNPDKQIIEAYHPGEAEPWKISGLADELEGEDVLPGFKLKVATHFN